MPRPRPPYLQREKTRHGKFVWYVRRGRGPRIRLKAEFGTPCFADEYKAALAGEMQPQRRPVNTDSLRWLWERYRESTAWQDLSRSTRRQRENILLHVLETSGAASFRAITRKHIEDGRDRRRHTPSQARNFLDAMRGLFRWALATQHITSDPSLAVRNPKRKATDGFPAWTVEDVAAYEARWPVGTRQRVWLHVLLYIGCRRGDAVLVGRQHVRNGILTFVTEKGRDQRRIEVTRRIEPELAATLAAGPCGDLAFVSGDRGKPLVKESFGNMFSAACRAVGIKKSAHGLRKLSATIWAERGATEMELMAMFGWMTPQMAALYTRGAHRRNLALNAHDRLMGTSGQHSMPAPSHQVRVPVEKL